MTPADITIVKVHLVHCPTFLLCRVEPQWLGHLWNHENMFNTGLELMSVNHRARSRGINRDIFFNMKVCCVFSLDFYYLQY